MTSMAFCGSRVTAFRGAQVSGPRATLGGKGSVCMMRKDIHPEYFPEAPVICNGVEVMRVSGTKPSYNVDIYSGNHPFYNGVKNAMVIDDGQLNKFKKKFADLGELSEVGAAASIAGKAVDEDAPKKSGKAAAKGKKK